MCASIRPETVEGYDAEGIVNSILAEASAAAVCLTCSFQAEDMIVLHLLRKQLPRVPVLFLETGYHFSETYQFRTRPRRNGDSTSSMWFLKEQLSSKNRSWGFCIAKTPRNVANSGKWIP